MIKRCIRCNGSKVIKAIGWIDKECPECKGTGIVTKTSKERLDKLNANIDAELAKAKAEKQKDHKTLVENKDNAKTSVQSEANKEILDGLTSYQKRMRKREERSKRAKEGIATKKAAKTK